MGRQKPGFADPDPETSRKARKILSRQSQNLETAVSEEKISPHSIREAARIVELRNTSYGVRSTTTPNGMEICLDYVRSLGYPLDLNYKRMKPSELIDYYNTISERVCFQARLL